MSKLPFLAGLAALMSLSTAVAVDLTPRYSDRVVGGVVHRQLFFADGDQKIYVVPGFGAIPEPAAGGTVFRFLHPADAQFVMRRSPMAADQPFGGVSLERYREAAHRLLPVGATKVKLLEESRDSITLNDWHSYGFLFAFVWNGANHRQSVTFLNLSPEKQIVLQTLSDEENYADAAERSWLILRTWHAVESKEEHLAEVAAAPPARSK